MLLELAEKRCVGGIRTQSVLKLLFLLFPSELQRNISVSTLKSIIDERFLGYASLVDKIGEREFAERTLRVCACENFRIVDLASVRINTLTAAGGLVCTKIFRNDQSKTDVQNFQRTTREKGEKRAFAK